MMRSTYIPGSRRPMSDDERHGRDRVRGLGYGFLFVLIGYALLVVGFSVGAIVQAVTR